jgi:hypothetical protein
VKADALAEFEAAAGGTPAAIDLVRGLRVVAAQLDAGRNACKAIAAAGHDGTVHRCRACGVLAVAKSVGLWTQEAEE